MTTEIVSYRQPSTGQQIVRLVCAVVFPPLGVFLRTRFSVHFWLCLALTLLGYIPGLVHAVWVLARRPEDLYRDELPPSARSWA